MRQPGQRDLSNDTLFAESPDSVLFNGRVGALTGAGGLAAKVGEKVRIHFGVGGFVDSNFHIMGEIFDRLYPEGGLAEPLDNVQPTLVPAGGATAVELTVEVPAGTSGRSRPAPRAQLGARLTHRGFDGALSGPGR